METPRKGVPTSQHGRHPGIGNGVAALVERLQALYVDELRQSLVPPVHSMVNRRQTEALSSSSRARGGHRGHPESGSPVSLCISWAVICL